MSRQPRLNVADGVYHVTQRGLERRGIVLDDEDRHDWWRLFDRQATRCGWRVFALALLDNHFHLFLRTPQPNLSAGMHAFESGFVTLCNRRQARTGPLFQGRFGKVLVKYETHAPGGPAGFKPGAAGPRNRELTFERNGAVALHPCSP